MEILIVVGAAFVVAVAIKLFRTWSAGRTRGPVHVHDALMKQAQTYASQSPFLRNVCRQYQINRHLSDRQAEAVAKAIARLDRRES